MPSHEELLIKSSGTGSLLLYYGYPLPASVYPTLATVINIVVVQSSNESRRGHVRFTYRVNMEEQEKYVYRACLTWKTFQLLCVKFIVLYAFYCSVNIGKGLEKLFCDPNTCKVFFFFFYFIFFSSHWRYIERKTYDALENFVTVI